MCTHSPKCPPVDQAGWETAALLVHHGDLGWSMLCNGAIVLDAVVRPEPGPAEVPAPAGRTRARSRARRAATARRRDPSAQPLAA